MKNDKQNALESLSCHFAILANRFAILLSRKMLHCTKNSFFALPITCTTTIIGKTKVILTAIVRIANGKVKNHLILAITCMFLRHFSDINYDASDKQVNKSAII